MSASRGLGRLRWGIWNWLAGVGRHRNLLLAGRGEGWEVFGETVRGASHVRNGQPNQDAIRWDDIGRPGRAVLLAVSDGHGSAASFRSDRGARLAVDTAVAMLGEFRQRLRRSVLHEHRVVRDIATQHLPGRLIREWRRRVDDDLGKDPFTAEEIRRLAESRPDRPHAIETVQANPYLAYGATLLAVLLTENAQLFFQLGDGDILLVDENGHTARPIPVDERLIANETTSLCTPDAPRRARVSFQSTGRPPHLVLVATDGYANSFVDEASFLQLGADILDRIRLDGLADVKLRLADWLASASREGSGDDITLGLAVRPGLCAVHARRLSGRATGANKADEEESDVSNA